MGSESNSNKACLPAQEKTTLIVKDIPASLTSSTEQLREFFTKYGASGVRPMESKYMKGIAFVDFITQPQAQKAYHELNRLTISPAYKRLHVEYAINNEEQTQIPAEIARPTPIAAELGLNYPANPHLQYRYPDPTPEIIGNMMNAIATVPRLYTQVLHLMNKMNLPPPFGPPSQDMTPSLLKRKRDELLASDESEIESDKDDEEQQKLRLRRMKEQQLRQRKQAGK